MKMCLVFTLLILSSCSTSSILTRKTRTASPFATVNRMPSAGSSNTCADLFAANLHLGHNLKEEAWERSLLEDKGTINSADFETFKNSLQWQKVIKQGGPKTSEEQMMAITILSVLKKKYPYASEQNLKERFLVLMQLCS